MIAYYELVESLKTHLQADAEINTVVIGGFDDIDLNKRSIFGLAHILVGNATFLNGIVRFDVTVSVMDVVDENNEGVDNLPAAERWKGFDNRQDVLNTMLSVIERLNKSIVKGTLSLSGYELLSDITAEPFEDRFENLLTGWSTSFTLDIPNTIQNC